MNVKSNAFIKYVVRYFYNLGRSNSIKNKKSSVLLNSIPKSGTHLCTQVLSNLGYIDFQGFIASTPSLTMKQISDEKISRMLKGIKENEIMCGHIFYNDSIDKLLGILNLPSIFIYRDPRAIFVSEWNYLKSMNRWHKYHSLIKKCNSRDEEFMLLINGYSTSSFYFPSFKERISVYKSWINSNNCHSVKFEDLINMQSRSLAIQQIYNYLNQYKNNSNFDMDLNYIKPDQSHTYSGFDHDRWKTNLQKDELSELNRQLSEIILLMGYEDL